MITFRAPIELNGKLQSLCPLSAHVLVRNEILVLVICLIKLMLMILIISNSVYLQDLSRCPGALEV